MQPIRMIRYFLSLAALGLCFTMQAQSLKVMLSFTSNSPFLSDWQSGAQAATLTIINTGTSDKDVKVSTELYYEGALVAKTNTGKMPVTTLAAGSTTRVLAEDFYPVGAVDYYGKFNAMDVMRSGKVPPGMFQFCSKLVDPKSALT
jgi:hypothetical protein